MTSLAYPWRRKHWHHSADLLARIRASLLILAGHETEICGICGGAVEVVWWCDDVELWSRLTGWGEGGVACVRCFDRLAERERLILQWVPRVLA